MNIFARWLVVSGPVLIFLSFIIIIFIPSTDLTEGLGFGWVFGIIPLCLAISFVGMVLTALSNKHK